MLAAPVTAGRPHAALHFVKNEKDVVLIGDFSQFLQPLATEMIVTALPLNGLDDDRGYIDAAFLEMLPDFPFGFLFPLDHVRFAFRFR